MSNALTGLKHGHAPERPRQTAALFQPAPSTPASADARFAATARGMYDELKVEVPRHMPGPDRFGEPAPALRRFDNLHFVHGGFLAGKAGLGPINANLIGARTIATQAPMDRIPSSMAAFASVLIDHKVGLILDLTSRQEQERRRLHYREGGSYRTDRGMEAGILAGPDNEAAHIASSATQRVMHVHLEHADGRTAGEQTLVHLNVPIADMKGTDLETLHKVTAEMRDWRIRHPDQALMVHCLAGVGRTGMLIVAERLLNLHDHGRLTGAKLADLVKAEVLFARSQRSDVMVQTPEQMHTLLAYGHHLLGLPKSPGARVPANYPELAPGRERPATYVNVNPADFRASVYAREKDEPEKPEAPEEPEEPPRGDLSERRPLQRRAAMRLRPPEQAAARASEAAGPSLPREGTVYQNHPRPAGRADR